MAEQKETKTYIGGQAVMEGILMRGKKCSALSVRKPDGTIETAFKTLKPAKGGAAKWPIVRGVVNFVSSMAEGIRAIYQSAELAGLEDDDGEPSKFDLWLEKKFGDKLTEYIMGVSLIIALAFSIGLFMLLPVGVTRLLRPIVGTASWALSVSEGLLRICIFIGYLALMSRTKTMRRLFEYHGAEHKTIAAFEHGEELTPENARKYTRLHKRCGTSFLLIVMIISMIVFFFVRVTDVWLRLGTRILFVPLIAGLSYEALRWAGRSDSKIVSILSWPGLQLQRLTTNEPDDKELEVAIAAMKAVLVGEGIIDDDPPSAEPGEEAAD